MLIEVEKGRSATYGFPKPWVAITSLSERHIPAVNWALPDIIRPNAEGVTNLPAQRNDPEDEGLYDDLV